MANLVSIISILVILYATQGILAVDYTVTNNADTTAGGARFRREIGKKYTRQTMKASTTFIWNIFNQTSTADRKPIRKVSLFINEYKNVTWVADTEDDQIYVQARYIQNYTGNVKKEFTGILYHEMTHVWQWNGTSNAPSGLIEGIADFVRLKAGYAPDHWAQRGQGKRWDQGYEVTAYFLEYCNDLHKGFVADLNKKMRNGYSNCYFKELLGKTVDQLWKDYKAKYGK